MVRTPNNTEVAGYDMAVKGRQIMFKSSQYGEYWRLLRPGTHTIQVGSLFTTPEIWPRSIFTQLQKNNRNYQKHSSKNK